MTGYLHDRGAEQSDEWQPRINLDYDNECSVAEFTANINLLHNIGGNVVQQEVSGAALTCGKIGSGKRRRPRALRCGGRDGGSQMQSQGYLQHREGNGEKKWGHEGKFDGCAPLVSGQSHGADTDEIARFSTEVS
jgi:hypothetical protein